MAIDMIEVVQKRLNLPDIQKIAPDTEVASFKRPVTISQVALVSVMAALYKLTRTTQGCVALLLSGKNDNWLDLEGAYGKYLPEIIDIVAGYGIADPVATEQLLRKIANASLQIMHEELVDNISTESIKDIMLAQRHNILMYTPEDLHLGKILNDNVLDVPVSKMGGPVSNLVH